LSKSVAVSANNEEMLCRMLKGIPKGAVEIVFVLSRLSYCGFFDWFSNREFDNLDPKIIFTTEDLIQCGIEVVTDE